MDLDKMHKQVADLMKFKAAILALFPGGVIPDGIEFVLADKQAEQQEPERDADGKRLDGPTVEAYVAAGYPADTYPPSDYASKSTPEEIAAAVDAQEKAGKAKVAGSEKEPELTDAEKASAAAEKAAGEGSDGKGSEGAGDDKKPPAGS